MRRAKNLEKRNAAAEKKFANGKRKEAQIAIKTKDGPPAKKRGRPAKKIN